MALSTHTEASQRSQPKAKSSALINRRVGLLAVIGVCVLCVLSVQAAHVLFHFSFCWSTSLASRFFNACCPFAASYSALTGPIFCPGGALLRKTSSYVTWPSLWSVGNGRQFLTDSKNVCFKGEVCNFSSSFIGRAQSYYLKP